MLGFGKKSGAAINDMSDREILEFLYREIVEIKDRLDDFEENQGGNEIKELKAEAKENYKFMQQLVMESFGVVRDKANKPTQMETYLKEKKEKEAAEVADKAAKAAKNGGAEKPRLPG